MNTCITFTTIELNCLHFIIGYIISNIKKNQKTCSKCIDCTSSQKPNMYYYAKFTRLKRISDKETLFFVNVSTFTFFLSMEQIFRLYYKQLCINPNLNVHKYFVVEFEKINYNILDCHNLKKNYYQILYI